VTAEAQVRKPEFGEVLPNITVAVGRDATLPCVVKHLQDYKVPEASLLKKSRCRF
jgi:hypothetical protein